MAGDQLVHQQVGQHGRAAFMVDGAEQQIDRRRLRGQVFRLFACQRDRFLECHGLLFLVGGKGTEYT